MKQKGKIKRKARIEEERAETEEFDSFRSFYRWLRDTPSCVKSVPDEKIVYEYSDSRTMYGFSERQKKQMRKTPQVICLFILAGLLVMWFLFSFLFRMITEAEKGKVLLSLLPSLFVTGVCATILLVSAFGAWEDFLRFVFSHNLARGKDAASRQNIESLKAELSRADRHRPNENAICVMKNTVIFYLVGNKYAIKRDKIFLSVKEEDNLLTLTFKVDGKEFLFPATVPNTEYVPLKKAFGRCMKKERAIVQKPVYEELKKKKYGGDSLGSIIGGFCMSTVILAAAIAITVAHFLWVPQIPLLVGVFFIGAAGLCYCNTFSYLPFVKDAGLPFVFSLILTACPAWFLVMIDEMITETPFSAWRVFSQCAPYSVAAVFLSMMGIYAFVHAVMRIVDYIRFGRITDKMK